jgi:hypothetical protein
MKKLLTGTNSSFWRAIIKKELLGMDDTSPWVIDETKHVLSFEVDRQIIRKDD